MRARNRGNSQVRGNNRGGRNNQVDQDNEFAIAAYETGSVNVNQANRFSTQIQVDALKLGAGVAQALRFTTEYQLEALNLGARPAQALFLLTEAHLDLYKTGLYSVREIVRIESGRLEKRSEKLVENGTFDSDLQKEAFESGKITRKEALQITDPLQSEALKYPSVTSLEDASLITKPIHLDALKAASSIAPSVAKHTTSYLAVSLMTQNDYSDEDLVAVAKVRNFYTYKLLKAGYDNITAEEALNVNSWFKYQAFMTGKVNATAAAEFTGPRYELLQTTELNVDEILRFQSFNQTKAYKTEKIPVDDALEVQNFCQILSLKVIQDPDLVLMKQLSYKCYLEIDFNTCKVVDLEVENLVIQGECTPEFTF